MKRFALASLILLASSCGHFVSASEAAPTPVETSVKKAFRSTIALVTPSGRVYCSGFISDGYVLTAAHCVEGDFYAYVRNWDGETSRMHVVLYNEEQDIAALSPLDGTSLGRGIPLARTAPDFGDTVFVIGHSKGELEYSLTRGIVSHPRRLDGLFPEMVWLQHDAGSIGGNSGGPVMNSRGRLVGITSFGILDEIRCMFGCPGVYGRSHISGAVHFETIESSLDRLP